MNPNASEPSRALLGFYSGDLPDHRGRFLADILQWPDDRLESVHDFVQWLFPLSEPSPVNPHAPVLDAATIAVFRERPELQRNLHLSFLRMIRFYGLEVEADSAIRPAPNFVQRAAVWLRPNNHNHLRITRIVKCLRTLGAEEAAASFYACLERIYGDERSKAQSRISRDTFVYWQAAAES
jgi:hypothetical protein